MQCAAPRVTALCGAPLAPLVVLAAATGTPTSPRKILESRSTILMFLVASSCRQRNVLMMNKVRKLHLLMNVLCPTAGLLPVGATPPHAEVLLIKQECAEPLGSLLGQFGFQFLPVRATRSHVGISPVGATPPQASSPVGAMPPQARVLSRSPSLIVIKDVAPFVDLAPWAGSISMVPLYRKTMRRTVS